MYRKKFPRLYELKDKLQHSKRPQDFYFNDFEKTIAFSLKSKGEWPSSIMAFRSLEDELEKLDSEAWDFLKNKVISLLSVKHHRRGWHQLFNTLNEAKGYNYLSKLGCERVRLIPRSMKNGVKTPDLIGMLNGRDILCEVKTINISDNEIDKREMFICRDGDFELSNLFFDKFDSVLKKAANQLLSYREDEDLRRIAYFVIHFDEPLEFSKNECNQKVSAHIDKMKQKKIEVRLHEFKQ